MTNESNQMFECQSDGSAELRRALNSVLSHQEALKDTISWETMEFNQRFTVTERLRLRALLRDIEKLESASQQLLRYTGFAEPVCTDDGRAANKVFNIPELLDEILLYLSIPDLLKAEATARAFRRTVAQSPRLRQKLFRSSLDGHPLRTIGYVGDFDLHDPWLGYSIACFTGLDQPQAIHQASLPPPWNITVNGIFQSTTGDLPPLSNNILDMFISQPPAVYASFVTACCSTRTWGSVVTSEAHPGSGNNRIRQPEGIRLRDFYEVAKGLLREHRVCPHASRVRMDDKGSVQNTVLFWAQFDRKGDPGAIVIPDTDPAWKPHRVEAERKQVLEARLAAYMAAKTTAFQNDEPIPTLEDFEARSQG
ncbi:hypothetical protein LTR17_007874 [Elasticomyces elasticus]|nr:hypothetical protein LTR17_007874 [Elasticomyces elasticus]